MYVFGRINVEWCNFRINIYESRAVLSLNFVNKASLLVSKYILCLESF